MLYTITRREVAILQTTVIGSYGLPGWLERAKDEYLRRRLSRDDLDEMHDIARKAAIKDQEVAGIDVITDGELQRDNMIDYFAERLPGVQVDLGSKRRSYDLAESVARSRLAIAPLGLLDDARFLRANTCRGTKVAVSGPHTLVKRIRNEHYPSEEAFAMDLARVMNAELREVAATGITDVQIDEPYYSGFPEDLPWAVRAVNELVRGVNATVSLHVCYGNRYGKPSWEGSYRYLFPAVLDARVQILSLEFARRGNDDLNLFREFNVPFTVGYGVIDVKSNDVETPTLVAERIRRGLEVIPADRLVINPDCGCFHLKQEVAFRKLSAMVEGTHQVRSELVS